MIKYIEKESFVTFSEVPDEISLCISITNCQNKCEGCHSQHLRKDIGKVLTYKDLSEMISKNDGISCVCFMGEGNDRDEMCRLSRCVKELYPHLKTALYSGSSDMYDEYEKTFDYLKYGPYVKECGPINERTTNQRMFRVFRDDEHTELKDITYKFWRNE